MTNNDIADPYLHIEALAKSFFAVTVLHGISFDAFSGEVLGIVGENGSGKSTAMNIIAGVLQKDGGSILLGGIPYSPRNRRESEDRGVAFIQQELVVFPNLSVMENLFLSGFPRLAKGLPLISRARMRVRAREVLNLVGLDVDLNAPASTLSPGECQMLEIARSLLSDARVVIFDEPTTSLTVRETEKLFRIIEQLKKRNVAIIYISHTLDDVLRLSDRIVVMRDGQATMNDRNLGITIDQLVVAMIGRSIKTLFPLRSRQPRTAERSLEVRGLSEPGVVDDVTFEIGKGEIIGLAGLMGAGRSELAHIIFGLTSHSRGAVLANGRSLPSGDIRGRVAAGMAFLTEDRRGQGLMMDASVGDNLALVALSRFARWPDGKIDEEQLLKAMQSMTEQLRLRSNNIRSTAVRTLSGGNQQKVVLGRWLLRSPTLLILDEPTRGVDVGAKQDIYRFLAKLADDGMGILIISSEMEELIGLCDRILVMRRGRIESEFARENFDREAILSAAFGHARVA